MDVNLRLLKKSEKEPNGFGPRTKNSHGGAGKGGKNGGPDDSNPLANSSESERAFMRFKEEYTLLPTQKVFKVERLTEYERDETLKRWELDKLLKLRNEQNQ